MEENLFAVFIPSRFIPEIFSASPEITIASAIAAVVVVISVITGIWFFLSRRSYKPKKQAEMKWQLLNQVLGSFFYIGKDPDNSYCSPQLVHEFDLLPKITSLHTLLSRFTPEDQEKCEAKITCLFDGVESEFMMTLETKHEDKKEFYNCHGYALYDDNQQFDGVIITFQEMTDLISKADQLEAENDNLKEDLVSFSNILNAAPFPIWQRNEDVSIRFCNIGYKEIINNNDYEENYTVPELNPNILQLAEKAKEHNKPISETHHIIVNGKRRLFEVTEYPVEDGKHSVGFAYDISEQENLKKKLAMHVSAQSNLLESTSSATSIYGPDMRLEFYNHAFVKLWGFDEQWLATKPTYSEVLERLREESRLPEQANFPEFKAEQLAMFTSLVDTHNEFFYLPDGIALRVIVIPHALGGLLFSYEDMTDRLALERSYNTLIEVQKETLDNLHEGVAVFGADGRLKLNNPVFSEMWDLDPGQLSKEPHMSELLEATKGMYEFPGEWEDFKAELTAEMADRNTTFKRIEKKDGTVIDSISVPLPDGATLITYIDMTDSILVERSLREKNEALEEADRIKTEFLANVSYELRSPLTSIMGFSEMMVKKHLGELNDKQQEYISEIYNSSNYLMTLINDILDLASIEAGYMQLDVDEFDIYEALASLKQLIKQRLKEKDIDFTFQCPKDIGTLLGDERRIKQAIFKLLSNAIKYSESGDKITMEARPHGENEIVIWIEDTGMGIAQEECDVIFDKFSRTQAAKDKRMSGTGLGLSVVKNFVELHGGQIEVKSEEGKGTVFTVFLPRKNVGLLSE